MRRTFSLVIPALLLIAAESKAQVKLLASGGIGISYNSTRNIDIKYEPIATPHVAANLVIPIIRNLEVETGLEYAEKGNNNKSVVIVEQKRDEYFGKRRYHYLTVPLTASYCVYKKGSEKLWLGAGMNYGFFFKGDAKYIITSYENGKSISKAETSFPVKSIWTKSSLLSASAEKDDVYKLDVMVRLQLRYCLSDKYFVMLFHDHSLYDINVNPLQGPSSAVKGRFTGISLGITIPD